MLKLTIASLVSGVLCLVCSGQSQSVQRKTPASSPPARGRVLHSKSGGAASNLQFNLESIDDVLWWLPEDTETVSVVRGPFKITPQVEPPANITAIEYADLTLRSFPLGILQTIEKGRFHTSLEGRSALFCVEGNRRFRPPTQLGGMLYEGCNIIILQEGLGSEHEILVRQLKSKATQSQTVAGQQVFMFEERLENDFWRFFVAVPAPNVLLCATNRDYLIHVLNRMHQRGQRRALPEDLPEWKYVNTIAKFWAVRHYNQNDKQSDPTSPLSGEQRAANWPDRQAVGIVFDLDPDRSKAATVKYLSTHKDALRILADYKTKVGQGFGEGFELEVRQNEPGVVEMRMSLDDRGQAGIFLFVLLGLLGHAVFS